MLTCRFAMRETSRRKKLLRAVPKIRRTGDAAALSFTRRPAISCKKRAAFSTTTRKSAAPKSTKKETYLRRLRRAPAPTVTRPTRRATLPGSGAALITILPLNVTIALLPF